MLAFFKSVAPQKAATSSRRRRSYFGWYRLICVSFRAGDERIPRSPVVAGRRHNQLFVVDGETVRVLWISRTFAQPGRLDIDVRIPVGQAEDLVARFAPGRSRHSLCVVGYTR